MYLDGFNLLSDGVTIGLNFDGFDLCGFIIGLGFGVDIIGKPEDLNGDEDDVLEYGDFLDFGFLF